MLPIIIRYLRAALGDGLKGLDKEPNPRPLFAELANMDQNLELLEDRSVH